MQNMTKKLNRMARQIIRTNEYTTLATTNRHGMPWVCILAYSYDHDWNLYFVSIPSSKHGKNIDSKNTVSCTIFDSHQDWGKGVGLQIEGRCTVLPHNLVDSVSHIYFSRKCPYGEITKEMADYFMTNLKSGRGLYKFYKIVPKTVWMNNPYSKKDERVKIDLKNFGRRPFKNGHLISFSMSSTL